MYMSHFWYPSCTPSCNVQLAGIPVSIACYSLLLRRHAIKCPPTSSIVVFFSFLNCPQCHVYNQLSVYKSSDWLEILKTVFGLNIAGNFGICCSYWSIQGEWRVKIDVRVWNSRLKHLFLLFSQTERAYQKQPTIFQNKKRVLTTEGGKEVKEKLPRYHKSVGLGFKTPREVKSNWTTNQPPISWSVKSCTWCFISRWSSEPPRFWG